MERYCARVGRGEGAVMGECYDSYLGEGDKFDMSGMPQRERFYTQP